MTRPSEVIHMPIDFNKSAWPNDFAAETVVVEPQGGSDGYEVRLNGFVLRAFPAEPQARRFAAQVRSALAAPVRAVAIEARNRCMCALDQAAQDRNCVDGRRVLDMAKQQIGRGWA
jgi:hypothetical protein